MTDLAKMMEEMLVTHANIARSGIVAGEEHAKRFIRTVVVAYDRALCDPAFRCPTYLHAAIQGARAYAEEKTANDYSNAMVKRDQEEPKWERDSRAGAKEPQ